MATYIRNGCGASVRYAAVGRPPLEEWTLGAGTFFASLGKACGTSPPLDWLSPAVAGAADDDERSWLPDGVDEEDDPCGGGCFPFSAAAMAEESCAATVAK